MVGFFYLPSSSQSQRRIWFVLPVCGACQTDKVNLIAPIQIPGTTGSRLDNLLRPCIGTLTELCSHLGTVLLDISHLFYDTQAEEELRTGNSAAFATQMRIRYACNPYQTCTTLQ